MKRTVTSSFGCIAACDPTTRRRTRVFARRQSESHAVEGGVCIQCKSPTIAYSNGNMADHKFIFDAVFDETCSQVEFKYAV